MYQYELHDHFTFGFSTAIGYRIDHRNRNFTESKGQKGS